MKWNYEIEPAKKRGRVLVCIDNPEKWVGFSRWLPESDRWENMATDQTPLAWFEPEHPLKAPRL